MAKLLAPYTLCPLIEHRKCLGVCEDSTPGCVIVTLGKNMVIRYRLSDQKQVNSWSSKDKLSAPVIFDFNLKRYVAVFKSDQVAFWPESLVQLNKLRKFKFNRLIYNVLSTKDSHPVIVYQNGNIGMLSDEMTNRKSIKAEKELLLDTEEILSSSLVLISGDLYVNLLTHISKDNLKRMHFIPVDSDKADRFSISLENNGNCSFNAYTVIEGESSFLITLWSDGSIYSVELPVKDVKSFPGRILSKVETVNLENQAVMHSVGEEQVVIYGAAPNSEGAVLCVFNLKFGLMDSCQKLKIYSDTPKLWVVSTNRYILCLSGGHLVVIPTRFVTQRLSSLIGIAKGGQSDDATSKLLHVVTASWKSNTKVNVDGMEVERSELASKILRMRDAGFTDHMICDELFPHFIEKPGEEQILELLSLLNDVPDHWLIDVAIKFNSKPQSQVLLENIFRHPLVSDNSSLQLVRSRISFPAALELLDAICKLMYEQPLTKSLLEWASILLDSHYQQYLLSRDEVLMVTMKEINKCVQFQMECMGSLKVLQAELLSLNKRTLQPKKNAISPQSYLVDIINLY